MTAVVELLLAFFDLAKTNLHQAKGPIFNFMIALALLAAAVIFMVGGTGMIMASLALVLRESMPVWAAWLITGAVALAIAGILLWLGKSKAKK